jgi:cyanophycinase
VAGKTGLEIALIEKISKFGGAFRKPGIICCGPQGIGPGRASPRFKTPRPFKQIIFSLGSAMGYILLEGGAEFGGKMAEPDRRALELAGGAGARVSIIPAAAAPDNNHSRAGKNGKKWFQSLGATHVAVLPLIDKISANDPAIVSDLNQVQIIYMLGGFPGYLEKTLCQSAAWQAMLAAFNAGAIIAGSSAGAMVLCEYYFDPSAGKVDPGLGLIEGACIIPHHDTFGKSWAGSLKRLSPETVLIGIDEQTGMLNDGPGGKWQVYGKGGVTLYKGKLKKRFTTGNPFDLSIPNP